jgi:hypothetical protein
MIRAGSSRKERNMLNTKLWIGSGVGAAGLWKFWPDAANWHPLLLALAVLFGLWVCLVVAIFALDHRRRHAGAASISARHAAAFASAEQRNPSSTR